MLPRCKRKKGGRPGNYNAIKHHAKVIRFVCSQIVAYFSKTNEDITPETVKKTTKQIVAEL
jgi:hypothetical protein